MSAPKIVKYGSEYQPAVIELPIDAVEYMLGLLRMEHLRLRQGGSMGDVGLIELVEMFEELMERYEEEDK